MPATPHDRRKWSVLSGLFLVYMASNGITLHTLPLLYPELIETFGWRASEVTLPATVFFIVGAFTSPPAGWLLDRYSSRLIIALGGLLLCGGLLAYGLTQSLWQLVAVYALLGLALSLCGLVSNMVMLTSWFSAGRGRATGILLMASSLGGALFPFIIGMGLEQSGWRNTVMFAGLGVGIAILGSVWLLLRDGRLASQNVAPPPSLSPRGVGSLNAALKERRFYAIIFITGSLWFIIIALTQHQSIHLARDIGLAKTLLPAVFSLFFGSSVIGKLGFGLLSDRFDLHKVMAISVLLLALALLLLTQLSALDRALLYLYAVMAGIGFSGTFTCIQLLVASHYSGTHYGRILAIVVLIDTLCGALGTRVVALLRESQGNYHMALTLMAALALIAAIVVLQLRSDEPLKAASKPAA
ncbi:MFS transporter [Luminiphilus sp.]|jgi:MFS family permease|nr:MFS transporter [Luminiphilus sp.]